MKAALSAYPILLVAILPLTLCLSSIEVELEILQFLPPPLPKEGMIFNWWTTAELSLQDLNALSVIFYAKEINY
jgi:hypothetical protein